MALAVVGNFLQKEAANTAIVCYNLLNGICTIPQTKKELVYGEEIKRIAEQALIRKPQICAMGFFTVNYTMFGFIVANLASYLIILIQFLQ